MKKNIIIALLSVVAVFFIFLSNLNSQDTSTAKLETINALQMANESAINAQEQEEIASKAAADAKINERKLEEVMAELELCRKGR